MKNDNRLRDTLFLTDKDVTQSPCQGYLDMSSNQIYGMGILHGVIGAIIAINGVDYDEAVKIAKGYLPPDFDPVCVPKFWRVDFKDFSNE